jgi:PEP-CTERM motif
LLFDFGDLSFAGFEIVEDSSYPSYAVDWTSAGFSGDFNSIVTGYCLSTDDCERSILTPQALAVLPIAQVSQTPLPATLPLLATGLGAIGLLGWRRKRKATAIAA